MQERVKVGIELTAGCLIDLCRVSVGVRNIQEAEDFQSLVICV